MIDENNFKQVLFGYTMEKYGNKIEKFYEKFFDEFPYDYEGLDDELHLKNFVDWLMIEKKLPDTGKTIVDEFVCLHPELNEEMKQKLLGIKNVIRSEFVVLSKKGIELIIKDKKTGKIYPLRLFSDIRGVDINSLLIGRIHPFGAYYRPAGALLIHNSPMILDPDIMMRAYEEKMIIDAEKLILSNYSKLTAILNKYPSPWVDGICSELSLNAKGKKNIKAQLIAEKLKKDMPNIFASLSEKSKEVLKILLDNEGHVNYGKLKDFEDEISFWWVNEPPTSTIGILRVKGLLAVGKMPQNGRMYKVALIPEDIREEIQKQVKA